MDNTSVLSVASAQVPQWHVALVIVNSTIHGGSGGAVATFSKAPGAMEIALLDKIRANAKFDGAREVITIDGVRVEYPDGFGLARPSNTTPVVVMRFEADNDAALARIQAEFKRVILAEKPDAQLPF